MDDYICRFCLNNIFKKYLYTYKELLSHYHMRKNQDNRQKFSDLHTAQLSFDLNTQLVFFYLHISIYINVNVFVLSIYLSVCLISMSNISTEVYDYIEYHTHKKKNLTIAHTNK